MRFSGLLLCSVLLCAGCAAGNKLVYQCGFNDASALDDWVMEGPGVAKVLEGRLLLYSRWQEELEQKVTDLENGASSYRVLEPIVKEKDPVNLEKYYLNGKFVGGHLQYWNKHAHPENFAIRIRFQPLNEQPLHLLSFCGRGVNGEDIFDPALKPRFGLAAQYTMGDLVNYRASFYAGKRGTINLRRAPGRQLVAKGEDKTKSSTDESVLLEMVRWNGRIQFKCDGEVVLDWTDPEPLGDGFFSIRLMNMARGYYDDYEVYELEESPFK